MMSANAGAQKDNRLLWHRLCVEFCALPFAYPFPSCQISPSGQFIQFHERSINAAQSQRPIVIPFPLRFQFRFPSQHFLLRSHGGGVWRPARAAQDIYWILGVPLFVSIFAQDSN